MNEAKRMKLEAKGWRIGSTQEFLGLSDAESAFIEVKLKLANSLRDMRLKKHLGQVQVAKIIHSSQSRVAKMEAADSSVSIDLLLRSLLALGTSSPEPVQIISAEPMEVRDTKRPPYDSSRPNKLRRRKTKLGQEIIAGLKEAIAYSRGEKMGRVRVVKDFLPPPKDLVFKVEGNKGDDMRTHYDFSKMKAVRNPHAAKLKGRKIRITIIKSARRTKKKPK